MQQPLDTSKIIITVNEKRNRFETSAGDETAYIDFQWHHDKLVLLYVYVPIPFRGKGYSKALIEFALNYARERNVKVDVYCSFIARYMQLHPQLAEGLR
jgi:predicted GNAT family acetyltransferase